MLLVPDADDAADRAALFVTFISGRLHLRARVTGRIYLRMVRYKLAWRCLMRGTIRHGRLAFTKRAERHWLEERVRERANRGATGLQATLGARVRLVHDRWYGAVWRVERRLLDAFLRLLQRRLRLLMALPHLYE